MNTRITIIYGIVLGLLSCQNNPTIVQTGESTNRAEIPDSEFIRYTKTLEQIPLPFTHDPTSEVSPYSKMFDRALFSKYHYSETELPLGIYYQDSVIVGIIDCRMGYWGLQPFLTTYDREGNKIDSLEFYIQSDEELSYRVTEHLTLNTDKLMIVADTTRRWNIPEFDPPIYDGVEVTSGKSVYRIRPDGKIERL